MIIADIKQRYTDNKIEELRPADILLVHTHRSLWGWLIRHGTHCYWNHALMVYSTGETGQDYHDTLVIDAKTDGSIVLRTLGYYISQPDKFDIAVKRLNDDLLDNDGLADLLGNICKTAVNEVQVEFAKRITRVKNQLLRQLTVIWRFIRKKLHKAYTQPNLPWNTRPSQVKAFTCGGFVQWCYYMGISGLDENNRDYKKDLIFSSRVTDNPNPFDLLTTTPADLANCDKLLWISVIKHGVTYSHCSNWQN